MSGLPELLIETISTIRGVDECGFCGTSRRDSRLYGSHRGCKFCRKSEFGSGPIGADKVPECSPREWLESKDREWAGRGGFSAFCKNYNLDEEKHREEAR